MPYWIGKFKDLPQLINRAPEEDPFRSFPITGNPWRNLEEYIDKEDITLIGYTKRGELYTLYFTTKGRLYRLDDWVGSRPVQENWRVWATAPRKFGEHIRG